MLNGSLWREIFTQRRLIIAVGSLSICMGIVAVTQAWLMAVAINAVFLDEATLANIQEELLLLLIVMLARTGLTWQSSVVAFHLADSVKSSLREKIIKKLLLNGPIPLVQQESGNIVNLVTDGIEQMEAYFSKYLPQMFTAIVIPPMILVMVVWRDPVSALLMAVTAPLIPFFMLLIGKQAEKLNRRQWDKLSQLSAHYLDILQGLTTLKIFGRSKEQVNIIARMAGEFRDTTMGVLKIAFLSSLTLELFATISTALVAVMVGVKLLFGEMNFVDAFFVLLLAPEYYSPLRNLGTQFHAGMSATAAAEKIFPLLNASSEMTDTGKEIYAKACAPQVVFNDVHFSYRDCPALDGVSFTLDNGECTVLVGESGSGKTTIANLLLRFIVAQEGNILIDGENLLDFSMESWLETVAYVPQNPHIFTGTIADNISFGLQRTQTEIEAVAIESGAHDFILKLPQGYETVVGEGGRMLSGGERQRLAIARALIKKASIIILDEPTAGLDTKLEAELTKAFDKLLVGKTALIIAHRLSTVRNADKIIVLRSGKVIEVGSPEELLKNKGEFARLLYAYSGNGEIL